MENSSDYYYEKLGKENNPGVILAAFYCSLYDMKVTRSEIIMFNKLVKTYSRFIVFYSILDITGTHEKPLDTPYPYLAAICKRRFESAHMDSTLQARESLDRYIASIDKKLEKMEKNKNKLKIPSSEGL